MRTERIGFRVPLVHGAAAGEIKLVADVLGEKSSALPVVFLVGGPGEAGTQALRVPSFRAVLELLAKSRQVILLDQRGCGLSEPIVPMPPIPITERFFVDPNEAWQGLATQARTVRFARPDLRPESLTPLQSAMDLARLANHLGVAQLDLLAYSYGTHLALAALKVVPDRLRRVVLCGFEGPDHTYKLPSQFAFRVDHAPFAGLLRQRLEQLDEEPVWLHRSDGTTIRFGGFGLRWMLGTWAGISTLYAKIPDLLTSFPESLPKAVDGFIRVIQNKPAAYYLNDSASGMTPHRAEQIEVEAPHTLLGSLVNFPFPDIREAWGQIDLGDSFRSPVISAHRIQIFTGADDPFTPTANALSALDGLANASQRELPGRAHNQLLDFPGAPAEIRAFFDGR